MVKIIAVVTTTNPKMQTRKTREEAKVVRSMNYPVPNFCFDHRFVRPNYAQRPATFPAQKPTWRTNSAPPTDQFAILAKTLFTNRFRIPAWNRGKPKV